MANNPITQRVKAAFGKLTFPVNQEVTLNADGTGGPIISPSGHVGKAPSCGCGNKTCKCGKSPNKMGCGSPAKQTDEKVLKAAKRGAKARAKSEFKFAQADAKLSKSKGNISKKEARKRIQRSRQDYKSAKKEIKKYTDY